MMTVMVVMTTMMTTPAMEAARPPGAVGTRHLL
jgi:hypothetical protein